MKHPNQPNRRSAHHNYLAHLEQERNSLLIKLKDREAKLSVAYHDLEELEQVNAALAAELNLIQAQDKQTTLWLNITIFICLCLFFIIGVLLS